MTPVGTEGAAVSSVGVVTDDVVLLCGATLPAPSNATT